MPKRFLDTNDEFDMEVQEPTTEAMTVQRTSSASNSVTTGRAHHGETQVSKKTTRFNPIDETEQVIMPFRARGTLVMEQNVADAAKVTFRLNSIYDIIHATLTDYNAEKAPGPDTEDAAAGSKEVPHYRAYWEKLYNYWHVMKCEWTFNYRLANLVDQDGKQDWALLLYEHGLQPPPTQTDVAGVKQLIPWYLRKYHPHVRKVNVKTYTTGYVSSTTNRNGVSTYQEQWQTVSGEFQPGNIKHEVVEDEYNQTWHKFLEVPPTAEKLTIMFQPNDRAMESDFKVRNGGNMSNTLEYEMVMVFTVQLKDRKFQFQFLQQGSDFPGTNDFLVLPAAL
jgi:hypothetical protein